MAEADFRFRIADAFPHDDEIAQYVTRLSIALGDLRVAAKHVVRLDQEPYERAYFVRALASHFHEIAVLFNPPDDSIPTVDEFIAAVGANDALGKKLQKAHRRVRKAAQTPIKGLPTEPGKKDPPCLAAELKRIRNDFWHYFYKADDAGRLVAAMKAAGDIESAYIVRENTMRAEYADEISTRLVHPWDEDEPFPAARALHNAIVAFVGPVSEYIHIVEAAYIHSCPDGVVERVDIPE